MEKKNTEYHRVYGLFSNMFFILRNSFQIDKHLRLLVPMGMLCETTMTYLWFFLSKFILDLITKQGNQKELLYIMIGFFIVQLIVTMIHTYFNHQFWTRCLWARTGMMQLMNRKAMTIDYEHLENSEVMDCFSKAQNACAGNNEGVEGMLRNTEQFLIYLTASIVGIAILTTLNFWVVLALIAISLLNFAVMNHTNKRAKLLVWDPLSTFWRKDNYMSNMATDFSFAKDIRMFGLQGWLYRKFRTLQQERYQAQIRNEKIWLVFSTISPFLGSLAQLIVNIWLIKGVIAGEVTLGNFSLYLAAANTFFSYLNNVLDGIGKLMQDSRKVDDFRSFLDFRNKDQEQGIELPVQDKYEFKFDNVTFCYPRAEKPALKNVNLTVYAGERLAVVGLNGAGKSTFIKLLLRLYEPTEGTIYLNGVDVKKYNRRSYYKVFAPIFQKVELFAFPLAQNISMQEIEKTDKATAEKCLRDAGFGEKLEKLKDGIDTEVLKIIDEAGVDFSGGEKQKIALSRALYKDAPVVVLDEPTAALDALAEAKLYESFDQLIAQKTSIYISHRLSSTQFCSRVAMFVDGEIVEYGTHEELMAKKGAYAEMFHVQAQYYLDNPEEFSNSFDDESEQAFNREGGEIYA